MIDGMTDAPSAAGTLTKKSISVCRELVQAELDRGSGGSVVQLVESIISHAYTARASDIHIDPGHSFSSVRFRIDGVLKNVYQLPSVQLGEVISRLKILCGLRTDEHQSAQDGRFRIALEDTILIDVRVSVVPVYYGENAVLRLLVGETELCTLEKLGFTAANAAKVITALHRPYGMILATGPTGSGKTTTLYTMIKMLHTPDRSIITIEDPIEYALAGINQIQVNSRTGLTFANGLRSMLRQDPNTIMVGEIRDQETAGLAVNISLTGHLVLSTLHTNDAATTLPRLLDMHVEPYLIASTVTIAIGQRLVRQLCSFCKIKVALTPAEVESLRHSITSSELVPGVVVWKGVGCSDCTNVGYTGRIGVHEVLVMTQSLREAVLHRSSASTLRSLAIQDGMVPLLEDGFQKVLSGDTTIEEIIKMRHE